MSVTTADRKVRDYDKRARLGIAAGTAGAAALCAAWLASRCNPVWLAILSLGTLSAFLAAWRWRLGVLLLFAWAPFPDFLKRLMLIEPSSVGMVEWNSILFVPDLILLAVLLGVVASGSYRRLLADWRRLDSIVLIFLIICSLQVMNPRGSLIVGLAGFKLTAIYVLLYFIGALADRRLIVRLIKITVVLGVITAAYALVQMQFGLAPYETLWLYGGYTDYSPGVILTHGVFRPFSTFASNAEFAFYMSISALFAVALWGFISRRSPSALLMYVTILLLILVIRSVHRGSWALTLVAFASLCALRLRKSVRGLFVAIIVVSAISFVSFLGSPASHFLRTNPFTRRAFSLSTYQARIDGMRAFIERPEYHSLSGNGLGMANFARVKFGDGVKAEPHNQLVEWSYELGVAGLATALWMVLCFYRATVPAVGALKISGDRKGYRIGAVGLAFISGTLLFGLFIQGFWVARPLNMYFWLFVGILPRIDALRLRSYHAPSPISPVGVSQERA